MAFVAGGAAEAPVLAELLIDLFVLLTWVVSLGLLWVWRHTIGAALRKAASSLDFHVLHVTIPLGEPLGYLDDVVTGALGGYANTAHRAVGYFWSQAAHLQTWVGDEIAGVAEDTYAWAHWLQHVHLPTWAKWALRAAFPLAFLTKLIVDELRKVLPHIGHLAHTAVELREVVLDRKTVSAIESEIARLRRYAHSLPAAGAAAAVGAGAAVLPNVHIFPRLRALELDGSKLRRRVKRLEKVLAAGGAAAIMANALGLPNWRCITRGNLGRMSRALCGIPSHLLNDLLGLIVDFLVLENMCAVLPWLEQGFADVAAPLVDVLAAAGVGLCDPDDTTPTKLAVPQLHVSPASGFTTAQLG